MVAEEPQAPGSLLERRGESAQCARAVPENTKAGDTYDERRGAATAPPAAPAVELIAVLRTST